MHHTKKIAALVLAAGYSSRMADFKPLMTLGNFKVIEKTIQSLKKAGISDITVVVGFRAGEMVPFLERLSVRTVFNENYNEEMLISVVKGLQSFEEDTEGFFLLPGDMPLVKSHTVRLLSRAFRKINADVVYPVFQKQRGHPPLITAACFSEILSADGVGNLRRILARHETKACEVEVLDEGILLDMDTPQDYRRMNETYEYYCRKIPTPTECDAILAGMNVPEHIVRHGKLVARVAQKLAVCLQQAGVSVDVDLVTAAGILHDLAKGKPDHAWLGARILKGYGFSKVAEIIAAHTNMEFAEKDLLTESALVYLADKMVKGEHIVSIDERFSSSIEKYGANAEAAAAIATRREQACHIKTAIEEILGASLEVILSSK